MEYEYNDYENSSEACQHDLNLLMHLKAIKFSLSERLELKLEQAKEALTTFTLSRPTQEEIDKLGNKVIKDGEAELEFNKKTLKILGDLLDSAIREGTKEVIKETYNVIQRWIDRKENPPK